MVFIFWQGIISIHQNTFLEALAKEASVSKVLLVVERDITPYRKNMGWEVPVTDSVEITVAPSESDIGRIFREYKDAVHIMGGIKVGKMLGYAFDTCIKHKCRLGIMTEPYNSAGMKGVLRMVKYRYYRMRYFRHIQFVLAIGKQGVKQYAGLGFDGELVFPWAYFINLDTVRPISGRETSIQRIIYAGRLEEAKGIYRFVEELVNVGNEHYSMDIYGEGPDEEKLKKFILDKGVANRFNFFPFLQYEELLKKYREYDWVVLPSAQKDGWGVIVSEGLLNGLKVICSSICGVNWVIKEGYNGVVFDWHTEGSCKKAINRMLTENTFAAPGVISKWASKAISGDAGAVYFLQIIDCVYNKQVKPGIPWLLN